MSVQFGRWNLDGRPIDSGYLERVGAALAPYGPDGGSSYGDTNISILYYAFHTTKESRLEAQPHISPSGALITWDGRLDNRAELITELRSSLAINSTDVEIVSTAYESWGTNCFAKLIGDWALSIWNPTDRSLILAKDPIGTRHLYYSFGSNQITWCSILDPLVLFADKSLAICEEYIAGWLSMFPAVHLTPYVGVHSVPPSSSVLLRPGKQTVSKYWDFDAAKKIRYRTDAEYEEHFRTVFSKAVQSRLRSDSPILAELSGGRDSSSIVCVADTIIAHGVAETPRLDTISYYDDSEPNWNERPYFTKVEEKRGRAGWHIDIGLQDSHKVAFFGPRLFPGYHFAPTPGHNAHLSAQVQMCLASQGNRVMLSGLAGDEVMGGVPIPTAGLQDLLASGRFGMFAHQLKAWALQKRRPWFHLFLEVALRFLPPAFVGFPEDLQPSRWLQSKFVSRHWAALAGYPRRVKLFASPPSFQDNISTLNMLRRQLASKPLPFEPVYEKSYPYLDRSLLEFMYALPREQSVRPTQRRSLMRRVLAGLVPAEVLNRKRKAFVARAPLISISSEWTNLVEMAQNMITGSLGIVDSEHFFSALEKARRGEDLNSLRLTRAIYIEGWLRNLLRLGIVNFATAQKLELRIQDSVKG
jgi:asparagine synthase (glutamine-hydrolysing)